MVKRGMKPEQARQLRSEKGLKETKLQKKRIEKGLSQNDLENISGVKKRKIQSYEQEDTSIDRARLETLCDLSIALDCKIEDILEDESLVKKFMQTK